MLELAPSFKNAPRVELAPLLRLKICNKRPAPSLQKKWVTVLGTIYETYMVYTVLLMKCDIIKEYKQ